MFKLRGLNIGLKQNSKPIFQHIVYKFASHSKLRPP
jgi:hypothetical protein